MAKFLPRHEGEVEKLLAEHPMAWLVPTDYPDPGFSGFAPCTLLSNDAPSATLIGHLPRRSPLVSHLETAGTHCSGELIFQGPSAYISPSWFGNRKQGPTWNFATVQFRGHLTLDHSEETLLAHLESLCNQMEAGRSNPWRLEELADRLESMLSMIVAFRMDATDRRVRFKLGQDEDNATIRDIMSALEAEPAAGRDDSDLRSLMHDHNADRLTS